MSQSSSASSSQSISASPTVDTLTERLVFVMFDEAARKWERYTATELVTRFAQLDAMIERQGIAADQLEALRSLLKVHDTMLPFNAVVIGHGAGHYSGDLGNSVLLGTEAGLGGLHEFCDYVALGAKAQPLASRTTMVGNTQTQVHTVQPVATRADARDFTDISELTLGLDLVLALTPKVATLDLREDYVDYTSIPEPPIAPPAAPVKPTMVISDPRFETTWKAYQDALQPWLASNTQFQKDMQVWQEAYRQWKLTQGVAAIRPDGTHKRAKPQTVVLAQDIEAVLKDHPIQFTGIWDGLSHHGMDVKTVRTDELVPVLIKAIQELKAYVDGNAFLEQLASRIVAQNFAARVAMRQYVASKDVKGTGEVP